MYTNTQMHKYTQTLAAADLQCEQQLETEGEQTRNFLQFQISPAQVFSGWLHNLEKREKKFIGGKQEDKQSKEKQTKDKQTDTKREKQTQGMYPDRIILGALIDQTNISCLKHHFHFILI